MLDIIFLLIKPFSEPSGPVDGKLVILNETFIGIEMFPPRIKGITQNVLICNNLPFYLYIKYAPNHNQATLYYPGEGASNSLALEYTKTLLCIACLLLNQVL